MTKVADRRMPKVGDVIADKYEIAKLIGEGGMGSVFMATHKLTGKQVAIKWMLPDLATNEDAVQRFLREAQAAGRINHPNVVDIYDVGEHGDSYFLVMEYLQGEPFTDALERGGMTASQVIDIILPCLRGVAAAHRKGVVHRDLKPDNIFLVRGEEGHFLQPKVLDFGISKLSGTESQMNPRLTRTGAVMGTPYYMSPEQIRGSHDVDGRCDVYAFGVILYEALTGKVPFTAETYSALVLEIATGTPQHPREVNPAIPDDLAAVVSKAMAREPGDRYQDILSLGQALEPFAESVRFTMERVDPTGNHRAAPTIGSVTSTPYSTEQAISVPGQRKSGGLLVGGVAALVAAAVVGFFTLTGGDAEPVVPATGMQPGAAPDPGAPSDAPSLDPTPAVAPAADPAAVNAPKTPAEAMPVGLEPPSGLEVDGADQDPLKDPHTDGASNAVDGVGADDSDEDGTKLGTKPKRPKAKSRKPLRADPAPNTVTAPKPAKPGRTGKLSVDDF